MSLYACTISSGLRSQLLAHCGERKQAVHIPMDPERKPPAASRSAASRSGRMLILLAHLVVVSGCGGGGEVVVYTTEARTSVLLTVVDPLNAPLPGVAIAYQIDGGAPQSQTCDSSGACATGFEVSGVFSIIATKVGYTSATGVVTVTRDACHVKTERLTLTLRPAS